MVCIELDGRGGGQATREGAGKGRGRVEGGSKGRVGGRERTRRIRGEEVMM